MSKYIKLEDAIYVDCILMDQIECKDCSLYDEERNVCRMVEWLESLPTIEVSEDCISREWVRENMLKYGFLAPDMTVTEFVADAPSVIPTTEPQMEYKKWETPPKVKNEGIITTCVGVPMASIEDESQKESEDVE